MLSVFFRITVCSLVLILHLSIIACDNPDTNNKKLLTQQTIKLGAIMPMTGSGAIYGENLSKGMELALSEINTKNKNISFKIIYEDDRGETTGAVSAIRKLIAQDKVQMILGPAYSGQTLAIAPIAEENKVIALTTLPGSIEIKKAGDFIFRVYASDEYQGKFLAESAYNIFKARKAIVFRANSAYAKALSDVIKDNFIAMGGSIIDEEVFNEGDKNMRTQLTKIKKLNPDLIFAPSLYADAANILVQAKELGYNLKFLGGDAWDGDIWQIIQGAENLGVFSKLLFDYENGSERTKAFFNAFREKYGHEPNSHAATGYDAVYIAKYAYDSSDGTIDGLKTALYKLKNFSGALGNISFDEFGDNTSVSFKLYRFENGKVKGL